MYSAIAQDLASRGATVLAIDHTYNAEIVEFPNGDVAYGVSSQYTDIESLLAAFVPPHAADLSFILDHFGFVYGGNATRAVAMGHSLGGAASITALSDRRFRGAVNLDGPIWGDAQNATIGSAGRKQAAVLWQKESLEEIPRQQEEWARFRAAVERSAEADFLAHVGLEKTQHYAFLDGSLLLDVSGVSEQEELQEAIAVAFGTISGERYMEVMGLYLQTFVDYVFGREGDADIDIYRNPPEEFSDVKVFA